MWGTRTGRIVCALLLALSGAILAGAQGQPAKEMPEAPSSAQAAPKQSAAVPQDLVAQEGWPRQVASGKDVFTVYQPQLDSWDGFRLEAYAAVSVKSPQSKNPAYGVLRFSALTEVDKDNRLVTLKEIEVGRVSFPAAREKESAYLAAIKKTVITKTRVLSLDRLEAMLAILEAEEKALGVPVKNDPPAILFSTRPATLIYVDGAPEYRPVKGSLLQRVVNTRALILEDATGKHYLHMFDGWLQAPAIGGPWSIAPASTPELDKALKDAVASGQVDLLSGRMDAKSPGPSLAKVPPPAIYLATTPAEEDEEKGKGK